MATFYLCGACKNLVYMVDKKVCTPKCCGETMIELNANTTDAAQEKHVPAVTVNGNMLEVKVGSVEHPMTEAHYIQWIFVETEKGGQIKYLTPQDKPEACFAIVDDRALAVYAYCNLHGLWKTEL